MGRCRALLSAALLAVVAMPLVAGCSAPAPLTLGVAADEPGALDDFRATAGAPAGIYQWFQAWEGAPPFDAERAEAATRRGALPLLTWEPWAPGAGAEQPDYALDRIAAGAHDEYVAAFARQVRDWGRPVALRFLHELNAPFYPWGAGVNGNRPADAVAAFTHVRQVFEREGARRVVWVWCVNVPAPGYAAIEPLFPGDHVVDWVAVDGYNGGSALPWGGWRTPEQLFGGTLDALARLSDRPVAITEVGSAEQGGDKAEWITGLFGLVAERDVRVLVWFDYVKEADWRIASSSSSAMAFRGAATAPGRLGPPPLPGRIR
ncbi:glycoside hydrolase family 26 protein [Blastococcus sp. SYSU DS0533]